MQHSLNAILFWTRVEYIGIAALSPCWLLFALEYTGNQRWLRPRRIALLFVIPVISLLVVFSSPAHTLFYRAVSLEQRGPLTLLVIERGLWSWVTVGYSYVMLLAGFHLVSFLMLRTTPQRRAQVIIVMLGMLMPFVANVAYIFGWLGDLAHLDITPFALTLTGVTVVLALFRYRLFDLLPLARDALWTSLRGGVMVLDAQARIDHGRYQPEICINRQSSVFMVEGCLFEEKYLLINCFLASIQRWNVWISIRTECDWTGIPEWFSDYTGS